MLLRQIAHDVYQAAHVIRDSSYISSSLPAALCRAAAKDPELEATYLNLLKETSIHEKAITRDLGR